MRVNHLEDGAELTHHRHATDPEILTHGNLEEEQRNAADDHGEEVRDQERS